MKSTSLVCNVAWIMKLLCTENIEHVMFCRLFY